MPNNETIPKWAEALAREILHIRRADIPRLIAVRGNEALCRCFCSYCGHETSLVGLDADQRGAALLDHICKCTQRPELRLVNIALAAEEAHEAFLHGTADDWGQAMANLRAELDTLKVKAATE